ncbi:hypothetical protein EXIGLDRAFT_87470 [Exidia glandulosa HHB12029]|uniref:Uncharacterized protein n=1 Tax=Exidia glandulosa HHB12029 TaxID=1314781 RepID=A0A165HDT9_EXIGL|nr:hypothetical protein EXIGLDRAFT_87470 [Exidia glandulosa HHB12029]
MPKDTRGKTPGNKRPRAKFYLSCQNCYKSRLKCSNCNIERADHPDYLASRGSCKSCKDKNVEVRVFLWSCKAMLNKNFGLIIVRTARAQGTRIREGLRKGDRTLGPRVRDPQGRRTSQVGREDARNTRPRLKGQRNLRRTRPRPKGAARGRVRDAYTLR